MKRAVPRNVTVLKPAKELVRDTLVEFIAFVASEAAETVDREGRKMVAGDDILAGGLFVGFVALRARASVK